MPMTFPNPSHAGHAPMGEFEGEHLVVRFFEGDAVCFELGAETIEAGTPVGW